MYVLALPIPSRNIQLKLLDPSHNEFECTLILTVTIQPLWKYLFVCLLTGYSAGYCLFVYIMYCIVCIVIDHDYLVK